MHQFVNKRLINPLNTELNPICHLLALLGGATIVVVSRLRVKSIFAEIIVSQAINSLCSYLLFIIVKFTYLVNFNIYCTFRQFLIFCFGLCIDQL